MKHLIPTAAMLFVSSQAHAACSATQQFTLDWSARTSESLSTTTTKNYTVTNTAGGSRNVGVSFGGTTNAYVVYADTVGVNRQMPAVSSYSNGGLGGAPKTLTLGTDFAAYSTNIDSNTNVASVTFTFSTPIVELAFKMFDVDFSTGQYRDWMKVIGRNGVTAYTPSMNAPAGNNNGTGTRTNAASWVNFGPTTVSGTTISASEALGINGNASLTEGTGNVNVSFAEPVTSVEIRYGNGPAGSMTNVAGVQGIGIHNLTFCPMPAVAVTKSSAPYETTGDNRFAIPGSDIAYALTVSNTGGSPVDIGTLVLTDPLPANVTFYNGDYDAASTGMGPIKLTAGTSGVTLPASGINYSTNGTTYTATATAGYNSTVRYVKLTPTGSLAANSSVTFNFRARIN